MSTYGLQVFDDNGVKTLDTSYRLTRSIATLTVSHSGGQIFYIYFTGLVNDGTWGVISNNEYLELVIQTGRIKAQAIITNPTTTTIYIFRY